MKKLTACIITVVILFTAMAFSASAADDENMVRMWLCSEINDKTGIGHVFLYFENISKETVNVGKYKLERKKTVSVGSFGSEGPQGQGVYYNLESELDHYSKLTGISTELNKSELEKVSKKIRNYNWWGPFFNCNYFALSVWNEGSDSDIPYLIFPQFTRFFIRIKGGISEPFDLFSRNETVYKQSKMK